MRPGGGGLQVCRREKPEAFEDDVLFGQSQSMAWPSGPASSAGPPLLDGWESNARLHRLKPQCVRLRGTFRCKLCCKFRRRLPFGWENLQARSGLQVSPVGEPKNMLQPASSLQVLLQVAGSWLLLLDPVHVIGEAVRCRTARLLFPRWLGRLKDQLRRAGGQ